MHKRRKDEITKEIYKIINNNNIENIEKELIKYFSKEGLSDKEISKFLKDLFDFKDKTIKNFKFRVISPFEVENLENEALDYLIELKNLEEINDSMFEDILTEIFKYSENIDLMLLKKIINSKQNRKIIIN